MTRMRHNLTRRGSVYLAVLGTAMIAGVLAFSALALQRVQNRMLTASSEVRQAQLNAEAALEMGQLSIKNDPAWRTNNPNGNWFVDRDLGAGAGALSGVDPLDADLTDSTSEPVVLTGVGVAGGAVQRIAKTVDTYPEPLGCLRSSVAAGGDVTLSGTTLRASNLGLITADGISASGSNIYGRVQALTVTGGTYRDTTTQIPTAKRPAMPNWSTLFDFYRDNGTSIPINAVAGSRGVIGRNGSFTVDTSYWTGAPTGAPTATINRSISTGNYRSSPAGLRVSGRTVGSAGAAQPIDSFAKPGQTLQVSAYVSHNLFNVSRNFRIRVTTKGTLSAEATNSSGDQPILGLLAMFGSASFFPISATLTVPPWSGDLEYAYVAFAGDNTNTVDFSLDDVTIQDASSGRFIYREVLGPGVNSINNTPDDDGIYWIDCEGNRIEIERSRIKGTLLLINPGAGSMIAPGAIHWSPATPGYPALLVDADTPANADFTIAATNRTLSEAEDGVNYNPAGMSHESFGTDNDLDDTYPSEIQGLILVRDDLIYQNRSLVRGSVIVGDQITASSGSLEVEFRPDALFNPPPGLEGTTKPVARPLSVRQVVGP